MTPSKLSDKIGQFVTIPHSVIKLIPALGSDALTLFVYLRYRTNSKTGDAFPSYDTIESETNLSRRMIAKAIRILVEAGLVERKRRFANSTIYTLVLPPYAISSEIDTNDKNAAISIETAPIISVKTAPIISAKTAPLSRLNYQDKNNKRENVRGQPRTAPKKWTKWRKSSKNVAEDWQRAISRSR